MMRNRIIALLVPQNVCQAAQEDFESRFQSMVHSKSRIRASLANPVDSLKHEE